MRFKPLAATLSVLAISGFLTLLGTAAYSSYLDQQIARMPFNKNAVQKYENEVRDKGQALFEQELGRKDIMILGSSELEIQVPEHPNYMFPNAQAPWQVCPGGRAYAQSLHQAIHLGSFPKEKLKDAKIVLITSLQWFSSPEIIGAGQLARFSELQYYKTLNNQNLDLGTRRYLAHRMAQFMVGNELFSRALFYSRLFISDQWQDKLTLWLLKPYYAGMIKYLEIKDKYQYLALLKHTPLPEKLDPVPPKQINFAAAYAKAEQEGKLSCTNNKFYVEDAYFDRWLKPNLDWVKGKSADTELLHSKEWEDLEVLMKVCRDNGIKLYVVFMSTNGYYYDYTGITKKARSDFYKQQAALMKKYGVPYLNLEDKEYVPYFYYDVMHLGWKGWLYFDEQLTKHFGKAAG